MKKLIFTTLVGLAMIGFTGCTSGEDAKAETKCSASGKCASDKAKKVVAKKCAASGKCGEGKCGGQKKP